MRRTTMLRSLIAAPGAAVMPGVYDALSARLAEQAGFELLNVAGSLVANATYGLPDVGLVTMTETVAQVRRIAAVTTIPLLVDADTGYGNAINVMRCVRELESAGAAGVKIEDQVFPKKCGHFAGKDLIPTAEMVGKIRAAIDARDDDDFVVVARTDARAVLGFDEAIARANAYADAGADVIFVEAPENEEELRLVPKLVDVPTYANMVSKGGMTPVTDATELGEMGYRIVNYGGAGLQVVMHALADFFDELRREGTVTGYYDRMMSFGERQERLGLPEIVELEEKYEVASGRTKEQTS